MLHNYLGLGFMFLLALLVALALPLLSQFVGPSRKKEVKLMPYESGMDPVGSARERFSVKFYLVAMLFIIFDIEIIFMYPWAVNFKQLQQATTPLYPFIEMLVFVAILFVGYIYLRKKQAFKWED